MPRTVTGMTDDELLPVCPLDVFVGAAVELGAKVELDPEFELELEVGVTED